MNFKNLLFKYWPFIFIFSFITSINFLSPAIGDDWEIGNWFSQNVKGDTIMAIRGIYDNWLHFNGRGLSNFLMSFFCYYKTLWNFISAFNLTIIIFLFSRLLEYKNNKISILLSILAILSVSNNIRMEVYSLICANIAFITPILLILIYLYKIKTNLTVSSIKIKKFSLISAGIFCLIISTLMENISIGFTITLGLLNLYVFIKDKKIDKLFLVSFIFSLLGSIFMITSPGLKITRDVYNQSLGLIGTLKLSLPNNINLIIYENKFIFFFISTITLISIISKSIYISNKLIRYFYTLFLIFTSSILFIPLIKPYIFTPFFTEQIFLFLEKITNQLLTLNFSVSIFWFLFLISFLIPILFIKKNKEIYAILLFIAIFSLIPASLVTQVGARIITIIVFIYIAISCGFFNQIKIKQKQIKKALFWLTIFGIFNQTNKIIIIYKDIFQTQKIRQSLIDKTVLSQYQQTWDFDKPLIIPAFKINTLFYTANPPPIKSSCHYLNFIKYYQLDPKTKVVFDDEFGYISLNLSLENDNLVKMEIEPLENNFNYVFYIQKDNLDYYVSTQSANTIQRIKIIEPGKYSLKCNMINKDNKIKTAYSSDIIFIK